MLQIMGSMFIIESVIGYIAFKLLGKNKSFLKLVGINVKEEKEDEIQSDGISE